MSNVPTSIPLKKRAAIAALSVMLFHIALTTFGQTQPPTDIRDLPPSQTLERDMTGAETHRYEFDLKANEFFQVRVDQKGVDVALKLIDATGQVLTSMDSPNGKDGPETLSFVATLAGNYMLEIIGFDTKAEKGSYTIRREPSRMAKAQDRRRVEVERLFVAGMTARDTDGQREISIKKFEVARLGWQELNDTYLSELTAQQVKQLKDASRKAQADAIFAEARTLAKEVSAESKRTSLPKFSEARSHYLEMYDKQSEADCLGWLGSIHSALGEKQKALEYYKLALPLYRVVDDRGGEAATLNSIGGIYFTLGEKQKALEFGNLAVQLFRAAGDIRGEANTLNNIGGVYSALGEKQKVLEFFNLALLLIRTAGNRSSEANTLINIGGIYFALGEKQKALEFFNLALPIVRVVGDKSSEANTLNHIGGVYSTLGEQRKALEFFGLALPLVKAVGDKGGEAATLNNIGAAYDALGEKKKALGFYNLSLPLRKDVGDRGGEATTLNNIALVYDALGETHKALEFHNLALPLRRVVGDKSGEATTLSGIGAVYAALGDQEKALEFFNLSLPLFKSIGYRSGEANALEWLLQIWQSLENPSLAILYGKQAVNIYQDLRQAIKGLDKETQKTYLTEVEPIYRSLADILISEGRFAQAEQVLAMLKEEEYFDFVRRDVDEIKNLSQRVPLNDKEQKLIARYSLLADRITSVGQEFSKLDEKKRKLPESVSLLPDEQKRYESLSAQLTDSNAAFKLFLDKELVAELGNETIKEIEYDRNLQSKLRKWGAGTVALRTVVTEDRYRVILTTPAVQIDGKSEIKAAALNKKVFSFREALQNPKRDPRPLGKEIYDILIKPIEKDLLAAGAKTLVWSLDGTLRYIPLAAVSPDGKTYLVEKYQNVVITRKTADDLSDSNSEWQALGVGVSAPQSVANPDKPDEKLSFSPLPGTKEELLAIVRDEKTPGENGVLIGRRYLDKDFTMRNLTDSLTKETVDGKRQYTVVHIASHFRLGSNWSNSFLLLGNGEVLTLEQLSNSPEVSFGDVELVTLSACNTAFADDTNGKEVDSLAEAIQTKYGKAVLATLWSVADESTSLLMSEFYRLRKKNPQLTKAAALQMAQQEMIAGKLKPLRTTSAPRDTSEADPATVTDYGHPYYWSPFVLIGNWR